MYGEPFDIPPPDELVFISSFAGGEVFRSGCCFTRGRGRIFYFSPGDESTRSTTTPTCAGCSPTPSLWAAPRGELVDTVTAAARCAGFSSGAGRARAVWAREPSPAPTRLAVGSTYAGARPRGGRRAGAGGLPSGPS